MFLAIAVSLLWIFLIIRIYVVYKNRVAIIMAISNYKQNIIKNHYFGDGTKPSFLVDCNDMEMYFQTFMRFWDFSTKHILSDEKYTIVKDYISNSNQ